IFDWFDGLLVGLTATPKDEVDHNTYRLFHLEDGVPTDAYGLEDAVADGFLVPPKGVAIADKFLRHGIRYADLSEEEKDEWDSLDWGADEPPDEIGAEELNRFLFNEDAVDKVLATVVDEGYKVAGGDRLGKTIIFAKNQAHAEFIQQRFDVGWPEHAGHFARVITHGTPYAQSLIDDFSTKDKAPHMAISVDMLDTGIDIPEVVNLVFFKMVRSKSKFWQMIGRGTRLCPDLYGPGKDKQDFLVFDFCGNLEYFSQDLPGSEGSAQKSLTQRIVEARVGLVRALGDTEPICARRQHAPCTMPSDSTCWCCVASWPSWSPTRSPRRTSARPSKPSRPPCWARPRSRRSRNGRCSWRPSPVTSGGSMSRCRCWRPYGSGCAPWCGSSRGPDAIPSTPTPAEQANDRIGHQ